MRVLALSTTLLVLAGCSETWTAPPFPVDAAPEAFAVRVTTATADYDDVTLTGDTLVLTRHFSSPDSTATAQLSPGLAAWQAFWRAADAAGVRSWPAFCGQRDSVATGGYDLKITYGGDQLRSRGFSSYPGRDGQCSGQATPEYQALLAAVGTLIGETFP